MSPAEAEILIMMMSEDLFNIVFVFDEPIFFRRHAVALSMPPVKQSNTTCN